MALLRRINWGVLIAVLFVAALLTGFFGLSDGRPAERDRECHTAGPLEQYDVNCEDTTWIDDEIRISEYNP